MAKDNKKKNVKPSPDTQVYYGVYQPGKPIVEKKNIAIPVSEPERRSIRYRCMRIANGTWDVNDGLKEWIESQFEPDMNWKNFTIVWDISKDKPYRVVRVNNNIPKPKEED